ncbi:MAG: hypothetical protein QOJ13_2322 [Gaiellales bacterium]|jgi:hypothetical protein|nr:hypothetical protein [Actinomycetota bacterium]MDX6593126.1 hypothetical protein [Gaiellales bacterium]
MNDDKVGLCVPALASSLAPRRDDKVGLCVPAERVALGVAGDLSGSDLRELV